VLTGGQSKSFQHGSGRLELADAIASESNPLTARVFVNRVWMEHFGEPLAASTTDFGARSEPPLHRDLLDWLAADFMRSGWSVKHLHRMIVLSSAYQQGSSPDRGRGRTETGASQTAANDPENKLLSHFPRRRVDFEAMRDSLLSVSGRLDLTMGGPSVEIAGDPLNKRRTVYGLVDRQNLPGMFRSFDFPVPDQCSERRAHTAVPQQTLFGLNSPFVMEQARALAASVSPRISAKEEKRLGKSEASSAQAAAAAGPAALRPEGAIDALFRRVLGRHATKREVVSCLRFLEAAREDKASDEGLQPLELLAQVILISNEALFID